MSKSTAKPTRAQLQTLVEQLAHLAGQTIRLEGGHAPRRVMRYRLHFPNVALVMPPIGRPAKTAHDMKQALLSMILGASLVQHSTTRRQKVPV